MEPLRAVVEEAIAGIQAGRQEYVGLVLGGARRGHAEELRPPGTYQVVHDLGALVH